MTDDDFDIDEYSFDALFADVPKIQRYGFFAEMPMDLSPDFADVIALFRELVNAENLYSDEDEYEWSIIASKLDEPNQRLAWVEWRNRETERHSYDNYYLRARDRSGALLKWEVQTYNPYFGCRVKWLDWVDEAVVMIYEDKHDTFVVSLQKDAETTRVQISSDWEIQENILRYREPNQHADKTLMLPALE